MGWDGAFVCTLQLFLSMRLTPNEARHTCEVSSDTPARHIFHDEKLATHADDLLSEARKQERRALT